MGEASIGTFEAASMIGEIIVFRVPGASAEKTMHESGIQYLECKVFIDAMNPVAEPLKVEDGVEEFFTGPNDFTSTQGPRRQARESIQQCWTPSFSESRVWR